MTTLPLLEARLFNVPLMAEASRAVVVAKAYGRRITGREIIVADAEMSVLDEPLREQVDGCSGEKVYRGVRKVGPVGHIAVEGALVNKGTWVGKNCGITSYEGLAIQIRDCVQDDSIKAVVFEIDSFGGEVDGCFACAEEVYRLSQAKPTFAILTDHACSAAYLIACACRTILIPPTGIAGSIGVITLHADYSGQLEQDGVKVTVLRAGEKKARPTPFEAMSDEDFQEAVAELEEMRREFAATVARYRGGRISEAACLETEAATYRGQKAVDAGLCDAVGWPADAFRAVLDQF